MSSFKKFVQNKTYAIRKFCRLNEQLPAGPFLNEPSFETGKRIDLEKSSELNKSTVVPLDTELIKETLNLENLELVGAGGFGEVHIGTDITDPSKRFALKVITSKYVSTAAYNQFRNEVKKEIYLLQKVNHPNVVAIDSWTWIALPNLPKGRAAIKMELLGINLNKLAKHTPLRHHHMVVMAKQVGHALAHLHELRIVHHDISSSNIMLTTYDPEQPRDPQLDSASITWKLVDFGAAKLYDQSQEVAIDCHHRRIGQKLYISPEKKDLTSPYQPFKADAYAFGVLCLESLMGALEIRRQFKILGRMNSVASMFFCSQAEKGKEEALDDIKIIQNLVEVNESRRWLVKAALPYF